MKSSIFQRQSKSRQIRLSVLTLVVFFVAFFAHSEHSAKVELDHFPAFELHDCQLCQQGVDTPPLPSNVAPITAAISLIVKSKVCNPVLARDRYFYPLQRAPPIFC